MGKLISVFSGCGGLDLGFKNAGFDIIWANDNWSGTWETYEKNFPETPLCKQSLSSLDFDNIPHGVDGIIGGPPCQSWSNAGNGGGLNDKRGKLFLTFIELLKAKQPKFFLAENVKGMLSKRNSNALCFIREQFDKAGYVVYEKCLNSNDYDVPQNRERLIFVGIKKSIDIDFKFPCPKEDKLTVKDAIMDLMGLEVESSESNRTNKQKCRIINHEYYRGGYSYIFMSRNRVLNWNKPSFTIQASGRQTSIHPMAPKMVKVGKDIMMFKPGYENLYRRLSVRECARIQTFPDDFEFYYNNLDQGYKMIGNAVPVNFAFHLAKSIKDQLFIDTKSDNLLQMQEVEVRAE